MKWFQVLFKTGARSSLGGSQGQAACVDRDIRSCIAYSDYLETGTRQGAIRMRPGAYAGWLGILCRPRRINALALESRSCVGTPVL